MPEYMLMLRGGDGPVADGDEVSPAEMQAFLEPYLRWLGDLERAGALRHARRLETDGAAVVRGRGEAAVVVDGPYTESKDIVGGYYLIAAAADDEAREIALGCPHLLHGGTVEVRRVAD